MAAHRHPHSGTHEIALLVALALAVAPLALIAAMRPGLTVAPITAIIVLLVPTITHASATASALDRIFEVGVGGLTGFAVSLLVCRRMPISWWSAAAARTLNQMARALETLLARLPQGLTSTRCTAFRTASARPWCA